MSTYIPDLPTWPTYLTYLPELPTWISYLTFFPELPTFFLPYLPTWPSYLTKKTFSTIQILTRAFWQFLRCFNFTSKSTGFGSSGQQKILYGIPNTESPSFPPLTSANVSLAFTLYLQSCRVQVKKWLIRIRAVQRTEYIVPHLNGSISALPKPIIALFHQNFSD